MGFGHAIQQPGLVPEADTRVCPGAEEQKTVRDLCHGEPAGIVEGSRPVPEKGDGSQSQEDNPGGDSDLSGQPEWDLEIQGAMFPHIQPVPQNQREQNRGRDEPAIPEGCDDKGRLAGAGEGPHRQDLCKGSFGGSDPRTRIQQWSASDRVSALDDEGSGDLHPDWSADIARKRTYGREGEDFLSPSKHKGSPEGIHSLARQTTAEMRESRGSAGVPVHLCKEREGNPLFQSRDRETGTKDMAEVGDAFLLPHDEEELRQADVQGERACDRNPKDTRPRIPRNDDPIPRIEHRGHIERDVPTIRVSNATRAEITLPLGGASSCASVLLSPGLLFFQMRD